MLERAAAPTARPTAARRACGDREKLRRTLRAGSSSSEIEVEAAPPAPARRRRSRSSRRRASRTWATQIQQLFGNLFGGAHAEAPPEACRRRSRPAARRRPASWSTWTACASWPSQRVEQSGHRVHRRDRQGARRGPSARGGPDVSREGVQRDLLPIVEGSTVQTKHGPVRTDHVLFIAAGAFHAAKPSDLIPELQGRFPIRVELASLSRERLRAHPDRAEELAGAPVLGAARAPRGSSSSSATTASARIAEIAALGQRADREHRRAAPAHRDGAPARGGELRRARPTRARGSGSTMPSCARRLEPLVRGRGPLALHPVTPFGADRWRSRRDPGGGRRALLPGNDPRRPRARRASR